MKIGRIHPGLNFVAANATGGMIPGWIVADLLEVPYVYVRNTRKKGGHKDLITGAKETPGRIERGDNALVMEELVNFAQTTCNSALALREAGFDVTHAACILSYDHAVMRASLEEHDVELIHLVTLDEVLTAAEESGTFAPHVVIDYRNYLSDPQGWMDKYGFTKDEGGGTQ